MCTNEYKKIKLKVMSRFGILRRFLSSEIPHINTKVNRSVTEKMKLRDKIRELAAEQQKLVQETINAARLEKDPEEEARKRLLHEKQFVSTTGLAEENNLEALVPTSLRTEPLDAIGMAQQLGWSVRKVLDKIMELEGLKIRPDPSKNLSEDLTQYMLLEFGSKNETMVVTPKVDIKRRYVDFFNVFTSDSDIYL